MKGITGVQTIQGYYYYLDRSVISLTSHGAKTFISKDKQPLPNYTMLLGFNYRPLSEIIALYSYYMFSQLLGNTSEIVLVERTHHPLPQPISVLSYVSKCFIIPCPPLPLS